jgi:hypothetical protein
MKKLKKNKISQIDIELLQKDWEQKLKIKVKILITKRTTLKL